MSWTVQVFTHVKSIPALLTLTFLIHVGFRRKSHDFHELRSGSFARPSGSYILRIAGNP